MTTLTPREPYSQEEINKLYPKELKLQLVQVVRVDLSLREMAPSRKLPANLYSVSATWYGLILFSLDLNANRATYSNLPGERTPVSSRFESVCARFHS